jgi:hypothetical protein
MVGDQLFHEILENMANMGMEPRDLLDAFLRDSEISGPAFKAVEVRKFFRKTTRDPRAKLWVDRRIKEDKAGLLRPPMWLTSNELAEFLKRQVTTN